MQASSRSFDELSVFKQKQTCYKINSNLCDYNDRSSPSFHYHQSIFYFFHLLVYFRMLNHIFNHIRQFIYPYFCNDTFFYII